MEGVGDVNALTPIAKPPIKKHVVHRYANVCAVRFETDDASAKTIDDLEPEHCEIVLEFAPSLGEKMGQGARQELRISVHLGYGGITEIESSFSIEPA